MCQADTSKSGELQSNRIIAGNICVRCTCDRVFAGDGNLCNRIVAPSLLTRTANKDELLVINDKWFPVFFSFYRTQSSFRLSRFQSLCDVFVVHGATSSVSHSNLIVRSMAKSTHTPHASAPLPRDENARLSTVRVTRGHDKVVDVGGLHHCTI